MTTSDHNDVSSTTTANTVFSGLKPPSLLPTSSLPYAPIQHIKTEVQTQLSPIYRRQQAPNSPSTCSSINKNNLSSHHAIQTPLSNIDTQLNMQTSPTAKTVRYIGVD